MLSFIAPSGTPIRMIDLLHWIHNFTFRKNNVDHLKKAICRRFGVKHCILFGTGRTGMAFLLKTLYELDDKKRNEVIIPSYTCYSVPASAEFGGLNIRVMDIDLHTLDYDYNRLERTDCSNVLAIISANLYGLPNNLGRIEQFAREKGVFFIDDAAQAMGAKIGGRFAGTFGDAGLFSLDKGKNITSLDGGLVVTNSDEIAGRLNQYAAELKESGIIKKLIYIIKVIIYKMFLHPRMYWIITQLPFLNLGKTVYNTRMPFDAYDEIHASLAIEMVKNLDAINNERISRALQLKEQIPLTDKFTFLDGIIDSVPVYLRLPLLVSSKLKTDLIRVLNNAGIGATGSYPNSLYDLPEIKARLNTDLSSGKNGKCVADEILTLPVHPYMGEKHMTTIKLIFSTYLN